MTSNLTLTPDWNKKYHIELQYVTLNSIFEHQEARFVEMAEKTVKDAITPLIDPIIVNNLNIKSELDAKNSIRNVLHSTNESLSLNYAELSEKYEILCIAQTNAETPLKPTI